MITYLQMISEYSNTVKEILLKEAPHTIINRAPPELSFLEGGIVDLGFENLGLGESEFKRIMIGFSGHGVALTGVKGDLVIRATGTFGAVIQKRGSHYYPDLPSNWLDAVLVIGPSDEVVYAGSLVRPDQLGGLVRALD